MDRLRQDEPACGALAALPEISFVGKMLRRYDIFCTFVLRSNSELASLLRTATPNIAGVKSSNSLQLVEVFKFERRRGVLNLDQEVGR